VDFPIIIVEVFSVFVAGVAEPPGPFSFDVFSTFGFNFDRDTLTVVGTMTRISGVVLIGAMIIEEVEGAGPFEVF